MINIKHLDSNINFKTNQYFEKGKEACSIMRFACKNVFPDKITKIKVPEEITNQTNLHNESLKRPDQLILYSNKFQESPQNLKEFIAKITKEIKQEGHNLGLNEEFNSYNINHLKYLNNQNFAEINIKIYTEEGYVYRRINKILREDDYSKFWEIRYYYFALLYSLRKIVENEMKITKLYRGLKLRSGQESFYKTMKEGQMILFSEFLSTTYDINIASKYAGVGDCSYLMEIHVPEDAKITKIENYSRFQNEREVLLPSGSILEFNTFKFDQDKNLFVVSLSFIPLNIQAFCCLLTQWDKYIDLSKLNFNLRELEYLFDFLNKTPKITQIVLKLFDTNLTSYFARYFSKSKYLTLVHILGQSEIASQHKVSFKKDEKIINLKLVDISKEEYSIFMEILLEKINSEMLYISNMIENSLSFLKSFLNKNNSLQILNLSFISSILISKVFCDLTNISSIKSLNLFDFVLNGSDTLAIGNFLTNAKTLEKLAISLEERCDVSSIAKSLLSNHTLNNLYIKFNNSKRNRTKEIKYSTNLIKERVIKFNQIHYLDLKVFLDCLFEKSSHLIKSISLASCEISKIHSMIMKKLIQNYPTLESLDLSNNLICEEFVNEFVGALDSNNYTFKNLSLINNPIPQSCLEKIRKLSLLDVKSNISKSLNPEFKLFSKTSAHIAGIQTLLIINDDKIVTASNDRTMKVWDASDNYSCIKVIKEHDAFVYSLLLLPTGEFISGDSEDCIRLWDPNLDFNCKKIVKIHKSSVLCVKLLANNTIISGSKDKTIKVWNQSLEEIQTLEGHNEYVTNLLEIKNGTFVSGDEDGIIKIWTEIEGKFSEILISLETAFNFLSLYCTLPDGRFVGSDQQQEKCWDPNKSCWEYLYSSFIKIWDPNNNYNLTKIKVDMKDRISSMLILPNGNYAVASMDNNIYILNDSFITIQILKSHTNGVTSILLTKQNKLISGSQDCKFGIWDQLDDYRLVIDKLSGHCFSINKLILLPDELLASCSNESIRIKNPKDSFWDINHYKNLGTNVNDIIYIPTGFIAAALSKIVLINLKKRETNNLGGLFSTVCSLVLLDNFLFASGSEDGSINIWDYKEESVRLIKSFSSHSATVKQMILLSNGNFASASFDKSIKIFDPNDDYSTVATLLGHENEVNCLCLLSNGCLISGSGDGTIRFWDPQEKYKCTHVIETKNGNVFSLYLLRNGKLASGGNNCILIWDVEENYTLYQDIRKVEKQLNWVNTLLELPDGKLLSGSSTNEISVWEKSQS
jgi:WD40 repeat protein